MSGTATSFVLTLYLVGADPDRAAATLPFLNYPDAENHARGEQSDGADPLRIFSAQAVLDLSAPTPVDSDLRAGAGHRSAAPAATRETTPPRSCRCCAGPGAVRDHEAPREDIGLVGIDERPGFPAWWDDTDRWNGWLNPGFTRQAAEQVVKWINRCYVEHPDASDRLEWDGDNIIHHQPTYEGDPGYAPFTIRPSEDGRYFIGGYSWTWCQVGGQ